MNFTIESIPYFYRIVTGVALIAFFVGISFQKLYRISINKHESQRKSDTLKKYAKTSFSIFAMSVALIILSLAWAGVSWLWAISGVQLTPGKLALISVVLGPLPLVIAMIASGVAQMIGGDLHEGHAKNCIVFGVDISGVLYNMFMMGWLTIFTGGLAMIGLFVSGIWAFVA